jgi:uncharacterized protein HemY
MSVECSAANSLFAKARSLEQAAQVYMTAAQYLLNNGDYDGSR